MIFLTISISVIQEKYYNMSIFGSEWNLESGYSRRERDIFNYPFRALFAGTSSAFQIILMQRKTNGDFTCGNVMQGFKV